MNAPKHLYREHLRRSRVYKRVTQSIYVRFVNCLLDSK